MRINRKQEHILNNPRQFVSNFKLTQDTLSHFTVENSIVIVGTSDLDKEKELKVQDNFLDVKNDIQTTNVSKLPFPKLDLIEPYHSIPFTIYAMPSTLLHYWLSPRKESDLHLPERNRFIANTSLIVAWPKKSKHVPVVIYYRIALQIWSLPFKIKHTPNVNVRCLLSSLNRAKELQGHGRLLVYRWLISLFLSFYYACI